MSINGTAYHCNGENGDENTSKNVKFMFFDKIHTNVLSIDQRYGLYSGKSERSISVSS